MKQSNTRFDFELEVNPENYFKTKMKKKKYKFNSMFGVGNNKAIKYDYYE